MSAPTTVALRTLQFSWGGVFDTAPFDGYQAHLVSVSSSGGTPGPTLCGIDRFAEGAPGWSVGGGVSGPSVTHEPCHGCVAVARRDFAALPVSGLGSDAVTAARSCCDHADTYIDEHLSAHLCKACDTVVNSLDGAA